MRCDSGAAVSYRDDLVVSLRGDEEARSNIFGLILKIMAICHRRFSLRFVR